MIPHLATSWNCARVMLGPLNRFTISRIWKEAGEERKEPKKWSCQCWNGFWEVLRGFLRKWKKRKSKNKKTKKRESPPRCWEGFVRCISQRPQLAPLASGLTCPHGPSRFAETPEVKAWAQLISVTWMSAMPLASAILSAWALSRLDEEQRRQTGSRSSSW